MSGESLPAPVQQANRTFPVDQPSRPRVVLDYTRGRISRKWFVLFVWQVLCMTIVLWVTLTVEGPDDVPPPDPNPGWGGFNQHPMDEKCYRQERTATLLAFFLGCLGIDQFYAHHWMLAVFKLLTFGGFGIWWMIDMVLWIVGGTYGTPGCPGGAINGLEWLH